MISWPRSSARHCTEGDALVPRRTPRRCRPSGQAHRGRWASSSGATNRTRCGSTSRTHRVRPDRWRTVVREDRVAFAPKPPSLITARCTSGCSLEIDERVHVLCGDCSLAREHRLAEHVAAPALRAEVPERRVAAVERNAGRTASVRSSAVAVSMRCDDRGSSMRPRIRPTSRRRENLLGERSRRGSSHVASSAGRASRGSIARAP
jgi:hypothetical protein